MVLLKLGNNRSVEQMLEKTCEAGSETYELKHRGNSENRLLYHFPNESGTHR